MVLRRAKAALRFLGALLYTEGDSTPTPLQAPSKSRFLMGAERLLRRDATPASQRTLLNTFVRSPRRIARTLDCLGWLGEQR